MTKGKTIELEITVLRFALNHLVEKQADKWFIGLLYDYYLFWQNF